ncbi:hypothetical protein V6N13_103332 [Hibiscus sabdariffa]
MVRIESYTKLENTKVHGSEIKYGPYENLPAFSYSPVAVHFESNQPFVVAQELVREIEISHWGNVKVTEHYKLIHGGAQSKGEFSRPGPVFEVHQPLGILLQICHQGHILFITGMKLAISTSHLRGDSKRLYCGVGFKEYQSFGIALPEGSSDLSVAAPFPVEQLRETKISHLDIDGRPVVVLKKINVVPEHNQYFQVYYRFSKLSMLREPLMLISGFFFFFVACIVYMRADTSISKSSASYLAKQQWEEVQAVIQQVQNIISRCLAAHDKLEASLRDLYRTGDIQACKAKRAVQRIETLVDHLAIFSFSGSSITQG